MDNFIGGFFVALIDGNIELLFIRSSRKFMQSVFLDCYSPDGKIHRSLCLDYILSMLKHNNIKFYENKFLKPLPQHDTDK